MKQNKLEQILEDYQPEKPPYTRKGVTTEISASRRLSTKIGDEFHTIEYFEKRTLQDVTEEELVQERSLLWTDVDDEVERQIDYLFELARRF